MFLALIQDNIKRNTHQHELPDAKTLSGGVFSKYAPGNTRVRNWSSVYETVVLKQINTIQLVPDVPVVRREKFQLFIMAPPSATDDDDDPENDAPISRPQIMSPT